MDASKDACSQETAEVFRQFPKGFPKGLHVLLVEPNADDRQRITALLEQCDYNVTATASHVEALRLVQEENSVFDIGLVDVERGKDAAHEKGEVTGISVVETCAKILPLMATTWSEKTDVMYSAVSAGAVDVLNKPISLQKLRNIYQHLVRKDAASAIAQTAAATAAAAAAGGGGDSDDDAQLTFAEAARCGQLTSRLERQQQQNRPDDGTATRMPLRDADSAGPGASPGPSSAAPGLAAGTSERSQMQHSLQQRIGVDGGAKFRSSHERPLSVDGDGAAANIRLQANDGGMPAPGTSQPTTTVPGIAGGEHEGATGDGAAGSGDAGAGSDAVLSSDKRKKVDWTPELHRRFVKAVDELGIDNAIPSRILEMMQVKVLTRHHIASHLQKYRKHRRNLLSRGQELSQSVVVQWPPGRLNRANNNSNTPNNGDSGRAGPSSSKAGGGSDSKQNKAQRGQTTNSGAGTGDGLRQGTKEGSKGRKTSAASRNDAMRRAGNVRNDRIGGIASTSQAPFMGSGATAGLDFDGGVILRPSVPGQNDGFSQFNQSWRQQQAYFHSQHGGGGAGVNGVGVGVGASAGAGVGGRPPFSMEQRYFDPVSEMRGDYDAGNDMLEAAIKDVLNNQDVDSFPLGLKPPILESILEEAEQKGFRFDIRKSPSPNLNPKELEERDIMLNTADRNSDD